VESIAAEDVINAVEASRIVATVEVINAVGLVSAVELKS
jgi:hypothetical protein